MSKDDNLDDKGVSLRPNQTQEHLPAEKTVDAQALVASYKHEGKQQSQPSSVPMEEAAPVRAGILVLIVTFIGFGGWAALAPIDGAALAPGNVIVESQNRVVQHLEGGIISNVHVRDGSRVEQGEAVITLSETMARADLDIVESELFEVLGQEARLMAERVGSDAIVFPDMLLERKKEFPEIVNIFDGQKELFDSRRASHEGRLQIFEQRIDALQQQIRGLRSLSNNLDGRIASFQKELSQWQELFDEGLADRVRVNEMERELFRLQGEKDTAEAQIAELQVRIGETRSELLVTRQSYIEDVSSELRSVQQRKAELVSRRIALTDSLDRRQILAPATGTVVGLKVHTVGSVVRSGDTLMEIVPEDQSYVIRARVQVQDIDRVQVGQLADLQLSAFNLQMSHVIEGELVKISADALEDSNSGERYYEAEVIVTESGMERMLEQGMYLVPGMPAEVMIKTGQRTVLQYLMEPLTRMFLRAFREE